MAANDSSAPAPPTYVVPYLTVNGASEAIEFYKKAFGAVEQMRMPAPDGRLLHAEVVIGEGIVYMSDDFTEMGDEYVAPPTRAGHTTVSMLRNVDDVDAAVNQAAEAGAEVIAPPEDMFWGARFAKVRDPFGHEWALTAHVRDVSPEEMMEEVSKQFGGQG